MFSQMLVNSVVDVERRLEIEKEKGAAGRGNEPYVNYLAPVAGAREERRSIFTRLFARRAARQPAAQSFAAEPCPEAQPC